jgi:predicted aspartyl protease
MNGRANVLTCEVMVSTPSAAGSPAREARFLGIWDTGATGSVITDKVVTDLGLAPSGKTVVKTANGERLSDVYLVDIGLPNGVRAQDIKVTDAVLSESDVLIGMDIIGSGDFSITNVGGITVMSFRYPSIKEIDYVEEARTAHLLGTTNRQGRRAAAKQQRRDEKKGSKP